MSGHGTRRPVEQVGYGLVRKGDGHRFAIGREAAPKLGRTSANGAAYSVPPVAVSNTWTQM